AQQNADVSQLFAVTLRLLRPKKAGGQETGTAAPRLDVAHRIARRPVQKVRLNEGRTVALLLAKSLPLLLGVRGALAGRDDPRAIRGQIGDMSQRDLRLVLLPDGHREGGARR